MLPHSAAFAAAVVKSHVIATKCEIFADGKSEGLLSLISGQITVDDQDVRRRASVALTDPTGLLTPGDATDLLTPFGNEIQLSRGITFPDGTQELISQGYFGIADVRVTDSGAGLHIAMEVFDRARRVALTGVADTDYTIAAGTKITTAIIELLSARCPWIVFDFPDTPYLTPKMVLHASEDPWKFCRKLASSAGCDLYFDPTTGYCKMQQVPLELTSYDIQLFEGTDAIILEVDKRWVDEGVYNHIVVLGASTGTSGQIKGEALDANPASSTFYKGKFGDRMRVITTTSVTSNDQANAMAAAELARTLGKPEVIQVQNVVHPCVDLYDTLWVKRAKSKIDAYYNADKVSVPMGAGNAMYISSRVRVLS